MEHEDGIFWELTSGIDAVEAQSRATDELAADRSSFATLLRRLPVGEIVTLVTTDGADLRGRILQVGSDVVRLGEVHGGGAGASERRIKRLHDIRIAGIVRLVRETAS
jgi:hypothetical protein